MPGPVLPHPWLRADSGMLSRYLQWAEECVPLQEKQSRWPGLLEELVKVFVGDKRYNKLPPGSPGLFPNVIPWLCNLLQSCSPKAHSQSPALGIK